MLQIRDLAFSTSASETERKSVVGGIASSELAILESQFALHKKGTGPTRNGRV